MNTNRATWIVLPLFGLLASACASAPVSRPAAAPLPATETPPAIPVVPAAAAEVSFDLGSASGERCAVVRRGLAGEVHDARVAERWPDKNYGHVTTGFAGRVHGAERATLLSFELPEIPDGAAITRARLTLYQRVCSGAGVSLHHVNQGWDEATVTWNAIAGAFDPSPAATLPYGAHCVGHVGVDVTALARAWQQGGAHPSSQGVVLRQDDANTGFATSEASDPAQRPTLEICWQPASVAWTN